MILKFFIFYSTNDIFLFNLDFKVLIINNLQLQAKFDF